MYRLGICFLVCPKCLGKADSLRRTNTCACAALCASISINHIALCTLRDSLNGALTSTCSTRNIKLLILLLTFDERKGTTIFEIYQILGRFFSFFLLIWIFLRIFAPNQYHNH